MAESLLVPLHIRYIQALASHNSSLTYHLTTHLRLNAIYWAVTALHLLNAPKDALPRDEVVDYVLSCYDKRAGGFGSHTGHDAHILSTLSGIQVLTMYDALDRLHDKRERIIQFILSLQDPVTGAFAGDGTHLEYDTRFLYCSMQALALLSTCAPADSSSSSSSSPTSAPLRLPSGVTLRDPLTRLDRAKTVRAVLASRNFDGGFGTGPGAESHAAQTFPCLGSLVILGALHNDEQDGGNEEEEGKGMTRSDQDRLATWLADRQLPNGGLNGRPQKLEDVCYSWWVLSSLSMLGKLHWVNGEKLSQFILSAQDPENGGIADRPDNVADVFHTLFGVAGLSLLQVKPHADHLVRVNPVYCLPVDVVERLDGLARPYQHSPSAKSLQP